MRFHEEWNIEERSERRKRKENREGTRWLFALQSIGSIFLPAQDSEGWGVQNITPHTGTHLDDTHCSPSFSLLFSLIPYRSCKLSSPLTQLFCGLTSRCFLFRYSSSCWVYVVSRTWFPVDRWVTRLQGTHPLLSSLYSLPGTQPVGINRVHSCACKHLFEQNVSHVIFLEEWIDESCWEKNERVQRIVCLLFKLLLIRFSDSIIISLNTLAFEIRKF